MVDHQEPGQKTVLGKSWTKIHSRPDKSLDALSPKALAAIVSYYATNSAEVFLEKNTAPFKNFAKQNNCVLLIKMGASKINENNELNILRKKPSPLETGTT